MRNLRTTEYKVLFYRLFLVYLFYFFARLTFYEFNKEYLSVSGVGDFFRLAFYGLLFDTTAIIYINLLFIFLSIIPILINTRPKYQKVLFWVYFLFNIPAYMLNFVDTAYFSYNKTRLTTNDWGLIQNENNPIGLLGGFLVQYKMIFISFLLLCGLWIFLYRKVGIAEQRILNRKKYFITSILVIVLFVPTLIFGIRGMSFKRGVVPLTVMDANKYAEDISQVNILLNTPFTIFRTMGKNKGFQEYKFTTQDYITENIKPINSIIAKFLKNQMLF